MLKGKLFSPGSDFIQRSRPHWLALAFYAALTALALDNLVLHFATATPATEDWDYAIFYWGLWWVKYAVFTLHRDPMFTNYVLYPYTVNLSLHPLAPTLGLMTAPLQSFLDLTLIYNGLIASSFVGSGYFAFLFLRRHSRNDWLAALGGAMFAFTPYMISRASGGHLDLLHVWWLPLQLLLWDVLVTQRPLRWRVAAAVGLGLAAYLALMTELQIPIWTLTLLLPYAVYTWIVHCRERERLKVLLLGLVALVFMLIPALIEPIPALLQTRGLVFPVASLETAQYYSLPLHSLVVRDPDQIPNSIGQVIPLLTLVCLPLGNQRRQRWLWLAVATALLILALGPYLEGTHVPLPYALVHKLMGGNYRTPVRFLIPATLALVTFITLSLADLIERTRALRWPRYAWLAGAVLLALILNHGLLEPFPVTFIPDYRIYHEIGRDPDEYALLEVPVGPDTGFGEFGDSPDLSYYAHIHHKQLINGTVARVPSGWLSKYDRSPLLRGLTGEYDFPPTDSASVELADKLSRWDMRYVLVHRDRLPPERALKIIQFLNVQPELCLVDEEGALLSYRRIGAWNECPRPEMNGLPASTARLAMGEPISARYVGPGWYDVEDIGGRPGRWAGEIPTATLRVLLPKQNMHVAFNAFAYPPQQVVAVQVQGQPVARFDLSESPQVYEFDLPASALPADGPALIELVHTRLLSASERTQGQVDDQRPLAAAYFWFEFK